MSDLISIITPAYNAAKYIAETLINIRTQTYQNWELLLVDDGSTDNTAEIVQAYCKIDTRIKYIYQSNGRQGKARNNGIRHAAGNYIAFIDADDLWLPEKLAVQLAELKKAKVDLVFSNFYTFSDKFVSPPTEQNKSSKLTIESDVYQGEIGLSKFLLVNRIPILTVLMRRTALLAVGGFSENLLIQNAEDYHLWIKLLLKGYTLRHMNQTLAAYRKHAGSVSDAGGFNFPFVVEAKLDLALLYPIKKQAILSTLAQTILMSLPEVSTYSDTAFYRTVNRYLEVSGKQAWQPLFANFQRMGAKKLTLKSMYFIFNYL